MAPHPRASRTVAAAGRGTADRRVARELARICSEDQPALVLEELEPIGTADDREPLSIMRLDRDAGSGAQAVNGLVGREVNLDREDRT